MVKENILKAQKTKKQLALFRVAAGSLCIIPWLILLSRYNQYSDSRLYPILLYPGIFIVLFGADWVSRKVYGLQVRTAYSIICETIPSFNSESDTCILLLNDVVSELCCSSLLFDKCGNDPYKDTWNTLYNSVSNKLTRAAFSQLPDNLTPAGEELLKLFLGLGNYGVSYGYLSESAWGKEIYNVARFLDVFENARDILDVEKLPSWSAWSDWEKRSWNRARKVLYKDIYAHLVISFHTLKTEFSSPVWDDIRSSPYPRFFDDPSEIKRTFCNCKDLTADGYVISQCFRWCDWHIENYPSAFVYNKDGKPEDYKLASSLTDLKDVYAFLKRKIDSMNKDSLY